MQTVTSVRNIKLTTEYNTQVHFQGKQREQETEADSRSGKVTIGRTNEHFAR